MPAKNTTTALMAAMRRELTSGYQSIAFDEHIKTVRVLVSVVLECAVQRIHLLGSGGNEQIAHSTFLDLGEQLAGGIEVEANRHVRIFLHVLLTDGGQGLSQGGGSEDCQLDGLGSLNGLFLNNRLSAMTRTRRNASNFFIFGFPFLMWVFYLIEILLRR